MICLLEMDQYMTILHLFKWMLLVPKQQNRGKKTMICPLHIYIYIYIYLTILDMNVNVFICCIYISPFLGTWELLSRCSSGAFHHPWCWHGTFCRRGSGSPTEWQGNPPNIAGSVALILNSNMCSKDPMNWHGPRYCW